MKHSQIPARNRRIVERLLEGGSYEMVADEFGLTTSSIRQIEKKARDGGTVFPSMAGSQTRQVRRDWAEDEALLVYAHYTMGLTLEQVGDVFRGVSRERARQLIAPVRPPREVWRAAAVAARKRRLALMVDLPVPEWCVVCGGVVPGRMLSAYCCEEHRQAAVALRWHCSPAFRRRHMRALAIWSLRNRRDASPGTVRFWERVLDGSAPVDGARWMVEGSQNFRWAVEAFENGWPLFDEFPVEIQTQIRNYCQGAA